MDQANIQMLVASIGIIVSMGSAFVWAFRKFVNHVIDQSTRQADAAVAAMGRVAGEVAANREAIHDMQRETIAAINLLAEALKQRGVV